ncbi:MAG: phosphomethylpyrimidine kinase, partial [Clostridia bacterium]|nr:phosphomethylpyrimidine kinase [Clostridia bacterium]
MKEKVLLMNDLPGYGKVALAAAMPILTHYGYSVYNLPTALVSNTLDYGKFYIQENTEYMKETIRVWEELGFSFDAVSTGFLASRQQLEFVKKFCEKQAGYGTRIFVDPIMGDNGKLYNGISNETVENMRELCRVADCIVPNFTEATFLADIFQEKKCITESELTILIQKLRSLGTKSVVIT